MSTKIYDAFRIKNAGPDFFLWAKAVITMTNEGLLLQLTKVVGEIGVSMLDKLTVAAGTGLPVAFPESPSPREYAHEQIRERQQVIRVTRMRDPAVDFQAELHCYMFPNGDVVGWAACEQDCLSSAVMSVEAAGLKAEDFSYWNNSDKPDDISEEAWNERKVLWDKVLDEKESAMFVVSAAEYLYPPKEQILQNLPSFESRVAAQAEELAFHWYSSKHAPAPDASSTEEPWRPVMRLLRAFHKERQEAGSEAHALSQDAKERVSTLLVKDAVSVFLESWKHLQAQIPAPVALTPVT